MTKRHRCCVCRQYTDKDNYSMTFQTCTPCLHYAREIASQQDITIARALINIGEEMIIGEVPKPEPETETEIRYYADKEGRKYMQEVQVPKKARAKKAKPMLDENAEPILPKRKRKYEPSEYTKLEYEFLNLDVVQGETDEDEVFRLQQLLDIALLGGDIEWARKLNHQIILTKGQMNQ